MIVLDAAPLIDLLYKLESPRLPEILSEQHGLVVPEGVAEEVKKEPARGFLRALACARVVDLVRADGRACEEMRQNYPCMNRGELEAPVCAAGLAPAWVISDDRHAWRTYRRMGRRRGILMSGLGHLLDVMPAEGLIDAPTHAEKRRALGRP